MNLLSIIVMIVAFQYLRRSLRDIERIVDVKSYDISEYTILLKGLPPFNDD